MTIKETRHEDVFNCEHEYVSSGPPEWIPQGLWKRLILTLYCTKCGNVINKIIGSK